MLTGNNYKMFDQSLETGYEHYACIAYGCQYSKIASIKYALKFNLFYEINIKIHIFILNIFICSLIDILNNPMNQVLTILCEKLKCCLTNPLIISSISILFTFKAYSQEKHTLSEGLRNYQTQDDSEKYKRKISFSVDLSGRDILMEKFDSTRFTKFVDFGSSFFQSNARFYSTWFNTVDFSGASFCGQVEFAHTKFDSTLNFKRTNFFSNAVFRNITFNGETNFRSSRFDSLLDFNNSIFSNNAAFQLVEFTGKVIFDEVEYFKNANYSTTRFNSDVYFINSIFHENAVFAAARFDSIADFSNCTFMGKINFNVFYLPKYLNLANTTINHELDLRLANFRKDKRRSLWEKLSNPYPEIDSLKICYINLINAPIEKIILRYDVFRVYVPDEINEDTFGELSNVYESLLKRFKDLGYVRSYVLLDKEYKQFKFLKSPESNRYTRLLNLINKHWNDYGYKKERIFYFSFGFFLFFSLLNWLCLPFLIYEVYKIESIASALKKNKKMRAFRLKHRKYLYPNYFSPILSIFYTGLIFFGLKVSFENLNFNRPFLVSYILLQYIVGLVCLAYLANFVITKDLIGI